MHWPGAVGWGAAALLWLSVMPAYAGDVEGAVDVPGLARFPHAEVVRFVQHPAGTSFTFALSDIDKIRGELRGRRLLRLSGARTSITYRIDPGYGTEEVMTFFERQLSYRGPDRFRCRGLGCGTSTLWANEVFGVALLYGTDGSQAYVATIATLAGAPAHLAVYVVERANRQVFAQVEVIRTQVIGTQVLGTQVLGTQALSTQVTGSAAQSLPATGGGAWRTFPMRIASSGTTTAIDPGSVNQSRVVLRDARATEALVLCYLAAPVGAAALLADSKRCATQVAAALQKSLPEVQFVPVGAGGDGRPPHVELVYRQISR